MGIKDKDNNRQKKKLLTHELDSKIGMKKNGYDTITGDGESQTQTNGHNNDINNEESTQLNNDIIKDNNIEHRKSSIAEVADNIVSVIPGLNKNIHENLAENEENLHNECEKFDLKTESAFVLLQIVSACLDIFAHGSNDVANAVAPFAAIYSIYQTNEASKESDIDIWILIVGALGMTVGLATYGYKILKVLGVRVASMTCSRGFCIVLSSAITVLIGSYFGLPTSTTHAQVGAVAGCGLCEIGNKYSNLNIKTGINWILLLKIGLGWIATLIIAGATSAIFFSIMVFSPVDNRVCSYQYPINNTTISF